MLTPDQLRELEEMRLGFGYCGRRGQYHMEPEITLGVVVALGIAVTFALFLMLLSLALYAVQEAVFG